MGARSLASSFLALAALLVLGCSIEQPVSGPVELTSEWKTIDPPEPLRVGGKHRQVVCLHLDAVSDADFEQSVVVMGNGQRHVVKGEAIDSKQETYALKVRERGGGHVCLNPSRGAEYPPEETIVEIRLRSDPPIHVQKIQWHSYDQQ